VILRRNASTPAPATVEGSCSLLGGSNLLTSAPADQEMLPDQQPTRTPTINRIVQRREVVSDPRRLSVLRPMGTCEERERAENGHPWPCFLSSLEWMEPQARYFSLCFPATNQPPRLSSREQYAAQLPILTVDGQRTGGSRRVVCVRPGKPVLIFDCRPTPSPLSSGAYLG
jgi:hypothetical protein